MIRFILNHSGLWFAASVIVLAILAVLLVVTIGDADTGDGKCRYDGVAQSAAVASLIFLAIGLAGIFHKAWVYCVK